MNKTRLAIVAFLAGLVTLVAAPAQAYPDPDFNFTGGSGLDGVVAPGATFTLTGDFGGVDCTYTGTFAGQTDGPKQGTTFSVTFKAPTKPGKYTGSINCSYDDGTTPEAAGSASSEAATTASYSAASLGEVPQSAATPFTITVAGAADDADNSDSNGVLPNTGGSNLWLLVAGGALLIAGSGVLVARRRA